MTRISFTVYILMSLEPVWYNAKRWTWLGNQVLSISMFYSTHTSTYSTANWSSVTLEWSNVRGQHCQVFGFKAFLFFLSHWRMLPLSPWSLQCTPALFPFKPLLNNIPAIVGLKYRTRPEVDVDTSVQAFFSLKLARHRETHECSRQHINVLEQIPFYCHL